MRAQFMRMLEAGVPADAIKVVLRLSRTTYFQWKRAYEAHGADGVRVRPIRGGTPKLTDQQVGLVGGGWSGAIRGSFSSPSRCGHTRSSAS